MTQRHVTSVLQKALIMSLASCRYSSSSHEHQEQTNPQLFICRFKKRKKNLFPSSVKDRTFLHRKLMTIEKNIIQIKQFSIAAIPTSSLLFSGTYHTLQMVNKRIAYISRDSCTPSLSNTPNNYVKSSQKIKTMNSTIIIEKIHVSS